MTYPSNLKPTPFLPLYAEGVQEWMDVYGFAMPLTWGDVPAEYMAIREHVAGIEFSILLKYKIQGADARAVVNKTFSRDISDLATGKIAYGVVLNDNGKMVDDVTVFCHGDDTFQIMCGNPDVGNILKSYAGDGATVSEHRDELAQLSVQGPKSRAFLQELTDTDLSGDALPYYNFKTGVTLAGINTQINRLGFTGELGYELVIPVDQAPVMWSALKDKGEAYGFLPVGGAALMTARTEAGLIMAELDYTQETSPFECRMGWAVDMDKQDFNGRASLDELKANVKTRVVTLRIPSAEVDYSGAVLALDGTEVGFALLAVPSPLVDGDFLAMATVANGSHKVGTRLELKGHVGVEAEIVSMPVYDSDRIKVRS